MVRTISIIFMSISFVLSVVLPIVLAIVLNRKLHFVWKSVLVGAAIFLFFQILTRIPLLGYLSKNALYAEFSKEHYLLCGFLIALSAGLFEETGRYIGFKFFLKDHLTWENGIGYGIGHGGLESLFIGTAFLNDLVVSVMINSKHLMPGIPPSVVSTLVKTPPYQFLIGGIERLFAFTVQIGLSLIVLYAVKNNKFIFLFLAILLHTILDFIGVALAKNIYLAELCIGMFAIASLFWIFKSRSYIEAT